MRYRIMKDLKHYFRNNTSQRVDKRKFSSVYGGWEEDNPVRLPGTFSLLDGINKKLGHVKRSANVENAMFFLIMFFGCSGSSQVTWFEYGSSRLRRFSL